LAAISLLDFLAAQPNTIRRRCANACDDFARQPIAAAFHPPHQEPGMRQARDTFDHILASFTA
jgi:hypothetical protein